MKEQNAHVWIWMENDFLQKAVYTPRDQTLVIYNEKDEVIIRRKMITPEQLASLKVLFLHLNAKRIDGKKEPFTYL
jgi:hypothetical protein